ncbi:PepSY-associated TM helix domain-containing protein [Sphingomonas endophytica]|nr:PepSY-associated TM helix domain-containing protein [Sphingomonas endophytica]
MTTNIARVATTPARPARVARASGGNRAMRWLSLLHRWTGAITGALLGLLGATGTLLVWRDDLTFVPHGADPLSRDPALLAHAVNLIAAGPQTPTRMTFASDGLGVHLVGFSKGTGAYVSQSGEVVARWSSIAQRPELWLFDLHHRLLLGETGETLNAIAGLFGLFFVISGTILWWRVRHHFHPRVWPAKMTPGAIVHHHRDLGLLTAPLLFLSMLTGVMMLLPSLTGVLLGSGPRARPPEVLRAHHLPAHPDFGPVFAAARARFPDAEPRRLQWPRMPGAPLTLRLRQPFEWNPNGQTFVHFDPATLAVVGVTDPRSAGRGAGLREKLYPLHAGKVGGLAWKLATTLSGIAMTLLGSLAVYGFWKTRANIRAAARRKRLHR